MRQRIVFILVCLGLVGCVMQSPVPASTITPAKSGTLRYMHLLNVDVRFVPTLMALDDLRAQGYTIERTSLASSVLIVDALARGDADLGSLNPQTMWTAIAKGANVRTFVQGIAQPSFSIAKREIQTCGDLDGKRSGFAAPTGMSPTLFDLYIKQHCPTAKPVLVVIPESAGRVAALLAGELDATQLPLENVLEVERKAPGKFHRLIDYSKEYPNLLTGVLNVREDWAKQNPAIVKDFLRALLTAHRRVKENPQLLYDEAVKRLGINAAEAKESGNAHLDLQVWDPNGGLTRENIRATLDFLTSLKAVPADLKPDDVADLSYLNAVLDEMGRK